MSSIEKWFSWLLVAGRTCIGGVMVYSGVDLMRGEGLLSHTEFDSPLTGIFVIVLGLYCILSNLPAKMFHSQGPHSDA